MRRFILPAFAAAAVLGLATTGSAGTIVPPEARHTLDLTLYTNGIALVKDRRNVTLSSEINELYLSNVSPRMIPDSVLVTAGENQRVNVVEQRFLPARLDPANLLKSHVGKSVKIVKTHPTTGEETVITGTLLSIRGGPIVRIGDRVVTRLPGRIDFDAVPSHLTNDPSLRVSVEVGTNPPDMLSFFYLTDGMSWSADYTGVLNPDGKSIQMDAWASLRNGTGTDFRAARVRVVAGSINRARGPRPMAKGAMRMEAALASAPQADAVVRQAVGGTHVYSLPRSVDLNDGDTAQVALMEGLSLPVERQLISAGNPQVWGYARGGKSAPSQPNVRYRLTNRGEGQPLPAGSVRLYNNDGKGTLTFLGQATMGDVPAGGEAMLHSGRAFDVTVSRTQIAFKRVSKNSTESAFEIELLNGGDKSATVKVIENVPGDWSVIEQSAAHVRDGNRAVWDIAVPAKGKTKLIYTVRVKR